MPRRRHWHTGVAVDRDPLHRGRPQQDRALQGAQRAGVVGLALGRDPEAGLCGEPDHGNDVGLVRRYGHQGRLGVDGDVEAEPGLLPARLAAGEQVAPQLCAEPIRVSRLERHVGL